MWMPTCVGDAYIARLSLIESERAVHAGQIAMLPRMKNSDRQRIFDHWQEIISQAKMHFPGTVTRQIREVRMWLQEQYGGGVTR